jgi:hypothetical protein
MHLPVTRTRAEPPAATVPAFSLLQVAGEIVNAFGEGLVVGLVHLDVL